MMFYVAVVVCQAGGQARVESELTLKRRDGITNGG